LSQRRQHEPERPEGQVTFDMANLSPKKTGLSFVVFVSQRAGARLDVRVKVGYNPKVLPSQMGVYGVRPFRFITGQQLLEADERKLQDWVAKNKDTLIGFWNTDIEYTEDMIEKIQSI
jgi:hypothetical protein